MGTRRLLVRRLRELLVLAALATAALAWAYDDIHRHPEEVRDRTAPAVLEVAAARSALMSAHLAARRYLDSGLADGTGTDEEYRIQITAAVQNLSQIADRQVAGENGRRTLSTVNALLAVYQEAIGQAVEHADGLTALSGSWFLRAEDVLYRQETGILFRLQELQQAQRHRLAEQTVFTGGRWTPWALTGTALLVLAAALAVTQRQLHHRFPQRLNPWLLAVCALLLASALPAWWAWQTQIRLDEARRELTAVIAAQQRAVADDKAGRELTARQMVALVDRTAVARERVRRGMGATSGGTGRAVLIPAGGAVAAALSWAGLQRHLVQYRFRP
ncbi:hypothetical protein V1L54_26130 [Streptomyces sp. TRM 70361]|uniref:hypothetical protein n=1 Tax=Streptomyces sp. TRM 70361 TaxID=3116553 RepID=UPI002E7B13A5|nr:hypothetical protein [Streptomyces sp. TRM 70361]MEE1942847.1 hypothetical protein [Streptomyces sp. TRM 70361]